MLTFPQEISLRYYRKRDTYKGRNDGFSMYQKDTCMQRVVRVDVTMGAIENTVREGMNGVLSGPFFA